MKKTALITGLLGLAILSVPTSNQAQISSKDGGYLFRIKYTKGDKATYKGTIATSFSGMKGQAPQPMNMTMNMSQVVTAVTNGVASVDVTTTMSGGPMGDGKPQTTSIKMDNRGKVVGGSNNLPTSYGLPEKPVRIGQTWTMDQDMGGAMPGMKMKATYKLIGLKNIGGRQIAEVSATTVATGQQMNGNGSGKILLRTSDGSMQSMTMKMVIKMSQGEQNFSVTSNIAMQRTN